MSSYFYIAVDKCGIRQYCKFGVTTNPRARINQYNIEQEKKYALLVKYETCKITLLDLEKMCLNATIKYYSTYGYGCSIEGRAGNITEIIEICKDVISNWNLKGIYINYTESDYILNQETLIEDFCFSVRMCEYFNTVHDNQLRTQLEYFDIFNNSKHVKTIYEFARMQIQNLNIKTVSQYLQHVEQNKTLGALNAEHMKYALKPKEHFSSVWTNWYDYLGVVSTYFIKDKEIWKSFCAVHKIYVPSQYAEACKQFIELAPDPAYWFTGFGNLMDELPPILKL